MSFFYAATECVTPPFCWAAAKPPNGYRAVYDVLCPPKKFFRTKLCPFVGQCTRGGYCTYAHSEEELRPLPDLRKTKLCPDLKKGRICVRDDCEFAHARKELKSCADYNSGTFKTSPCFFWKKGKCLNGIKCRFAHGTHELRRAVAESSRVGPADAMEGACRMQLPAGCCGGLTVHRSVTEDLTVASPWSRSSVSTSAGDCGLGGDATAWSEDNIERLSQLLFGGTHEGPSCEAISTITQLLLQESCGGSLESVAAHEDGYPLGYGDKHVGCCTLAGQ